MAQGEKDGDDLAVNLSWPGTAAVVPGRRSGAEEPVRGLSPPGAAAPEAPTDQRPPEREAPARKAPSRQSPRSVAPARQAPADARPMRSAPPQARQASRQDALPATRRPQPKDGPSTNGANPNETLLSILDHLSTLSRLVTGTSKASAADLDALGSRMDKAVAELDALQLRVIRSLAGFDALRLRVQKEMAERPPLTDDEVDRIADAVTQRLLENVRVETEGNL